MFQFQNLRIVVANRLEHHIQYSHLSLYRISSTESTQSIIVSMNKGEVTTLTLLDLSAAFDNKPEYLTDLLVGPKCSKCLHSTNLNRFFVHSETSPQTPLHCSLTHFRYFLALLHRSSTPLNRPLTPSRPHSMPLRHLLPPYIAFQCFCIDLYRLFFAFLTPSRRSLMPVIRYLMPLHHP